MDPSLEYGAQVKCRDCYTMIPTDPGTDSASVLRRERPECLHRSYLPRVQRRAAQHESASSRETHTSASPLYMVAEMKEKYGDTLQVDGVVAEEDNESVEETIDFATRSTAVLRTSPGSKNQGSVQVTVELPQYPSTP